MTEHDAQFAGWAITALLVLASLAIVCLTLVIQMLLTGRMGLKRKSAETPYPWTSSVGPIVVPSAAAEVGAENPHGFERSP
jgi:hypothetical protein